MYVHLYMYIGMHMRKEVSILYVIVELRPFVLCNNLGTFGNCKAPARRS